MYVHVYRGPVCMYVRTYVRVYRGPVRMYIAQCFDFDYVMQCSPQVRILRDVCPPCLLCYFKKKHAFIDYWKSMFSPNHASAQN